MPFLNISKHKTANIFKRKPKAVIFSVALTSVVISLGTTLTANISLNSGSVVEFGQGVSRFSACDSEVVVTPLAKLVGTSPAAFKFSGFKLSDLDTTDQSDGSQGCSSKYFIFKVLNKNGDILDSNVVLAIQSNGNVLSEDGDVTTQNPGTTNTSASFTFTSPSVAAGEVNDFTFESRDTVPCYGHHGTVTGLSECSAAPSGYWIAQHFPTYPSGIYWIQSNSMPNPLQMYVDMTEEGGGYDFYCVTSGPAVDYVTSPNGGTPLGLDLVMPRSKYHWRAMKNAVINFCQSTDTQQYFQTMYGVYRDTDTYGGNFTNVALNSDHAGPAWRVKDGGRWWLRDTPMSEPNGDYALNGFLYMYSDLNSWNLDDFVFNDGGTQSTGNYYLVSTNVKP